MHAMPLADLWTADSPRCVCRLQCISSVYATHILMVQALCMCMYCICIFLPDETVHTYITDGICSFTFIVYWPWCNWCGRFGMLVWAHGCSHAWLVFFLVFESGWRGDVTRIYKLKEWALGVDQACAPIETVFYSTWNLALCHDLVAQ